MTMLDVRREYGPPRPPVMAAIVARTNAELIEHIAPMYLPFHASTIDLTYGETGGFWQRYRPRNLTFHSPCSRSAIDFRLTPYRSGAFERVVYDPPYVAVGKAQATDYGKALHGRFGLESNGPRRLFEELVGPGMDEAERICAPGGLVLAKCQAYITSKKLQRADEWMADRAESLGLEIWDEIVHVSGVRPQPAWNIDGSLRRAEHARANYSTLWIFRKPMPKRGRTTSPNLFGATS